jgi:hypothetical protein
MTSESQLCILAQEAPMRGLNERGSLEPAVTYLNGLKPPIEHRFDLGYGYVFDSPRFAHGFVGRHERRIVGFPVLQQIDVYYEISASKPLVIEVIPGWVSFAASFRGWSIAASQKHSSVSVKAVEAPRLTMPSSAFALGMICSA